MREPARPRLNSGAAPDGRAAPTVTSLATENAPDRAQDWLPTRSVSTPSRVDPEQAIHTLMLIRPLTTCPSAVGSIMTQLAARVKSGMSDVEDKTTHQSAAE